MVYRKVRLTVAVLLLVFLTNCSCMNTLWLRVCSCILYSCLGRSRHLRLFPILALNQEVATIKVEEPKGSTLFTTGTIRQGSTMCMCVAMKRHVIVYEFNRTKQRHKKVKELTLPAPCSCLELFEERLCAGYTSGFGLFSIQGEGQHIQRKYSGSRI